PIIFQGDLDISFRYRFLDLGQNPDVGRHGGVTLFASGPASNRGNGYTLDWLDQAGNHGLRWNETPLGFGGNDPPEVWRIRMEGETISIYADGLLVKQVADNSRRQGSLGFWAYQGEWVVIDDLVVKPTTPELVPCFTNG